MSASMISFGPFGRHRIHSETPYFPAQVWTTCPSMLGHSHGLQYEPSLAMPPGPIHGIVRAWVQSATLWIAYASGFTGLGVAATRFAADVMLDRLEGLETERTSLRMVKEKPLPFPPEPAASIGVNLVRRAMDKADHNDGKRGLLLRTLDAVGMGFDS